MDKNLLKNTSQRINVHDESVLKKTEEYLRLYHSKGSIKSLNDQAKTVLCLDLASQSLGKGFDKTAALALSGLKKTAYQNSLNTLEKILGLEKSLTVADVCVLLGCTDVKEDAEDILKKYKSLDTAELDHPQYIAAATYVACRAKKVAVDKSKILSISRLKRSQWNELIKAFECLKLGEKAANQRLEGSMEDDYHTLETENNDGVLKNEVEEVEDYEDWKKRILNQAYAALKAENEKMEQ